VCEAAEGAVKHRAEDEAAVITRRLRELLDIATTQIGTSLSNQQEAMLAALLTGTTEVTKSIMLF
jgi:hypothetical protein